jgi:hypothetical protein
MTKASGLSACSNLHKAINADERADEVPNVANAF